MRSLPLFKFGPRARSTSWGIALCTMFIVASFSVAGGLRSSMDTLKDNFSSEYCLVTKPGPSGPAYFTEQDVSEVSDRSAFGIVTDATVLPQGYSVTVFAFVDNGADLPEGYSLAGDELLSGVDTQLYGNTTLHNLGTVNGTVVGHYSSTIFPSDWLLASLDLVSALVHEDDRYNFLISRDIGPDESQRLESSGFVVQPLIGIVGFLDSGVNEISKDTAWVLIPSSFVIAVLAYSFLGTETSDRRHDIGIIKTLGAGRSRILLYLLANAVLISAWGGLLGLALGVSLSYGISTLASSLFTSVFLIKASATLLLISYLATVAAGAVGALIPSVRMTFSSPVEDLKEVAPFS